MIAFLIGGLLIAETGWRTTFIIFGGIGLLLAVIFKVTVKEPSRYPKHGDEQAQKPISKKSRPSFHHSITLLLKIPSYRGLCLGAALAVLGAFGLVSWIVDLYTRNHHLDISEIGSHLALIYGGGGGGSAGMLIGGYTCGKLGQKNSALYLIIPGSALILSAPFLAIAIWSPTTILMDLSLGIAVLLIHFYHSPVYALAQMLAPPSLKAQSAACIIFIQVFFGIGLSPLIVGGLSDTLTSLWGSGTGLSAAMSLLCIALLLAGYVFVSSAKGLRNDLK